MAEALLKKYADFTNWFDEMTMLSMELPDGGKQLRLVLFDMLNSLDQSVRDNIAREYPALIAEREAYEAQVAGDTSMKHRE